MQPRREEKTKALEPSAEPKRKRFRIVKLEERVAPSSPRFGQATQFCNTTPASSCLCSHLTCGCAGVRTW